MKEVLNNIKAGMIETAINQLLSCQSGIDWNEDALPCEALDRDINILRAVNDLHTYRLTKDDHFLKTAILMVRHLSGEKGALEILQDKDAAAALVAQIEIENM
jgi:hypothetical protein